MSKIRSDRTTSELLFESYLIHNGLGDRFEFEPNIEGRQKKPDYLVSSQEDSLFFEVKQIEPRRGDAIITSGHTDPYGPIRKKINEGAKKFKEYKDCKCSLVIFNNARGSTFLSWHTVYGAMLGDCGFRVPIGENAHAYEAEGVFLNHGKMRPHDGKSPVQNSRINAIIALGDYQYEDPAFTSFRHRFRGNRRTKDEEGSSAEFIKTYKVYEALAEVATITGRSIPRIRVFDNPYTPASMRLPQWFPQGPLDERFVIGANGVQRTHAGHLIRWIKSSEDDEA